MFIYGCYVIAKVMSANNHMVCYTVAAHTMILAV